MLWTVLVVSPRACRFTFLDSAVDLVGLGGFDEEEATLDALDDVDQLCKICRWSSFSNCDGCSFSDVTLLEWGSCQRSSLADVWIGWKLVMFRPVMVSTCLFEMYMVGCVLWDGLLLRSEITFLVLGFSNCLLWGEKMWETFCIACERQASFG
jgi:hypothetical protein